MDSGDTNDTKDDSKTSKLLQSGTKPSNGLIRTITGLSLLAGFYVIIYVGLSLIMLMAFLIQLKCFDEVIKIAYNLKKIPDIPLFRTLNWYFLIVANYFLFGQSLMQHCDVYISKYYVLGLLASYHKFVSFCLYFLGLICFMMILRRKLIRQQFSLLFWTHSLLMIICVQVNMSIHVMFEGLIWLIVPIWLVILNDVFAYVFGKYFGKTPLISLSPKKTVEGFILGGLSTFVLGAVLSYIFCHFKYLTCPIKFVEVNNNIYASMNCTPSYLFQPIPYEVGISTLSINYYPFIEHSIYMSIFASIIAPFGGFCASGFKRAFNIKDFGDFFPGHGGFMDRFDCQFLMMTFVNVYISTFVAKPNIEGIFQKIMSLNDQDQLDFYWLLKDSLSNQLS